jgi:hypothetical protein
MSCSSHYSDESCSGCSDASPGTCPSCGTARAVCADCGYWKECEGTCGEPADCICVDEAAVEASGDDEEETASIPAESMAVLVFGATERKAA